MSHALCESSRACDRKNVGLWVSTNTFATRSDSFHV